MNLPHDLTYPSNQYLVHLFYIFFREYFSNKLLLNHDSRFFFLSTIILRLAKAVFG